MRQRKHRLILEVTFDVPVGQRVAVKVVGNVLPDVLPLSIAESETADGAEQLRIIAVKALTGSRGLR